MNETTKRCPKCGRELPTYDFGYDRRRKDRLQRYCRDCTNILQAEWRQLKKAAPDIHRRIYLQTATLDEILEELRKRGYTGNIESKITI